MFRISVVFSNSAGFISAGIYDDLEAALERASELNEQYAGISTKPRASVVFA